MMCTLQNDLKIAEHMGLIGSLFTFNKMSQCINCVIYILETLQSWDWL